MMPRRPYGSAALLAHSMQLARLPSPVLAPKPEPIDRAWPVLAPKPQVVDRAWPAPLASVALRAAALWAWERCAVGLRARVAVAVAEPAPGSTDASLPAAAVPRKHAPLRQQIPLALVASVQPDASRWSLAPCGAQSCGSKASPRNARAARGIALQPTERLKGIARARGRRVPAVAASRYSRCTATRKCSAPARRAASMACTTTPCDA